MNEQINIHSIYDAVKRLGLADNQYVFSRLCGRTPAWYSCIKSRKFSITPAAAMTLSVSLRMKAQSLPSKTAQDEAIALSTMLLDNTCAQITAKQSEYLGCPQQEMTTSCTKENIK